MLLYLYESANNFVVVGFSMARFSVSHQSSPVSKKDDIFFVNQTMNIQDIILWRTVNQWHRLDEQWFVFIQHSLVMTKEIHTHTQNHKCTYTSSGFLPVSIYHVLLTKYWSNSSYSIRLCSVWCIQRDKLIELSGSQIDCFAIIV